MNYKQTEGARLSQLRSAVRFSRTDFAKSIGLHDTIVLDQIEQGERPIEAETMHEIERKWGEGIPRWLKTGDDAGLNTQMISALKLGAD